MGVKKTMSGEPNQNPGGGPGEKNKSTEIQGKRASVRLGGAEAVKSKERDSEKTKPEEEENDE